MTGQTECLRGTDAGDRAIEISDILRESYMAGNQRWSEQTVRSMLVLPGALAILHPNGCAILRAVAGEAEILTIAVRPAARRQGTGAAVLKGAIDAVRSAGAARVFLEVASDNPAALALYRRHGFRQAGTRRGYYARASHRVDALVMSLEVASCAG